MNDKIGIVRLCDIILYVYDVLWGVCLGIFYVDFNGWLFSW